jgi:hypothetical protein
MEAIHKNDLSAYLSDRKMQMETVNKLSKIGKNKSHTIPRNFQAIFEHAKDLWIVLRYLDSRLKILENNKLPLSEKYQDFADAVVFLKCTYIFYRILLDTIARIIRYFYRENEGIELPDSLFMPPDKSKKRENIPKDLSVILNKVYIWFPELKDRRDDLVHDCESFLILFEGNKSGMNMLKHSNITPKKEIKSFGRIREYIGFLLCEYQKLIDNLLDHFDSKFKIWYGIVASKASRSSSMMEWNSANMLWWAVKYGGYKNPDLRLIE